MTAGLFKLLVTLGAVCCSVSAAQLSSRSGLNVGGIFDRNDEAAAAAFEEAVRAVNERNSAHERLTARVAWIARNNVAEAKVAVCSLLEEGVIAIVTDAGPQVSGLVQRISDKHEVPHLTFEQNNDPLSPFTLNLRGIFKNFSDAVVKALGKVEATGEVGILSANRNWAAKFKRILDTTRAARSVYGWFPSAENVGPTLALMKRNGVRHFVVDIQRQEAMKFLMAVKKQRMNTKDYRFLLAIGDANDKDLRAVGVSFGVLPRMPKFPQADLEALWRVNTRLKSDPSTAIPINAAVIYDGVLLLASAVRKLAQNVPVRQKRISCTGVASWDLGTALLNTLKTPNTEGRVARSRRASDLRGRVLRIAVVPSYPFVIEPPKGSDEWRGFNIDLLKELAKRLGFNYTIHKNKKFGALTRNGTWNGVIGELLTGTADMAVAPLTITYERERVVDFTTPYTSVSIKFITVRASAAQPNLFAFLQPFTNGVWIAFIVAFVLISLLLFVVAKLSPYEWRRPHHGADVRVNHFSLLGAFWFAIAGTLRQNPGIAPRSAAVRVIAVTWWTVVLLFFLYYVISLVAFLEADVMEPPPKNFKDLAKSNMRIGAVLGGSTAMFFKRSMYPTYEKIWNIMDANPGNMVKNYREGVNRVMTERYAFIGEDVTLQSFIARNCQLIMSNEGAGSVGHGFALPSGSIYRDAINKELLMLKEDEAIAFLRRKWLPVPKCRYPDNVMSPLTIRRMSGIFCLLIIGAVLGIAIAILECVWKRCCGRRDSQAPSNPIVDFRGSIATTKRAIA